MAGPRPPPTSRRPLTAIRGPEPHIGASARRLASVTAALPPPTESFPKTQPSQDITDLALAAREMRTVGDREHPPMYAVIARFVIHRPSCRADCESVG